ncbi:hypothetical protein C8R44DRAFT_730485 [Mycena epipterygia]|nr:hypothetical protein C8R44DRAFT_730485 [Mycena epipterygia]
MPDAREASINSVLDVGGAARLGHARRLTRRRARITDDACIAQKGKFTWADWEPRKRRVDVLKNGNFTPGEENFNQPKGEGGLQRAAMSFFAIAALSRRDFRNSYVNTIWHTPHRSPVSFLRVVRRHSLWIHLRGKTALSRTNSLGGSIDGY